MAVHGGGKIFLSGLCGQCLYFGLRFGGRSKTCWRWCVRLLGLAILFLGISKERIGSKKFFITDPAKNYSIIVKKFARMADVAR